MCVTSDSLSVNKVNIAMNTCYKIYAYIYNIYSLYIARLDANNDNALK